MSKNDGQKTILTLLANHLGIEVDDISMDDAFTTELHMSSVDLADFAHTLESNGYLITPEEIAEFDTVGELTEFLAQEEVV